jgi:aspartate/methionine/tyrosine aminotransferase
MTDDDTNNKATTQNRTIPPCLFQRHCETHTVTPLDFHLFNIMYGSIETPGDKGSSAAQIAHTPPPPAAANETLADNDDDSSSGGNIRMYMVGLIGFLAALLAYASRGHISTLQQPQLLSQAKPADGMSLSYRGQSLKSVRDDIPYFVTGKNDAYHPTENPDGYLVMLIAENKLMWKEMAKKIEQVQASGPLPEWIFNYGDFGGDKLFKASMAKLMQHWINGPVDPNYLRFQAGAGAILAQLSYILTDPGDGVLTTAPDYPAFAGDFGIYGGAKLHVADTDAANGYAPTTEQLDDCFEKSTAAGNPPRIFVICQPNNPTGVVYPKEDMDSMVDWALKKGLHVVSDEIYALSTLPGYNTSSAADVMWKRQPHEERYLGDRVHVVHGLSKDWGMSGFRVGSLFSHNSQLLNAMDMIGYYPGVSSYAQHALTGVFQDEEFVSWYIEENQRRLYETYQALEEALDLIDVQLVPSQGAIFAWANFSSYIQEGQTEKDLWMELFNDARVALTSGESCLASKPGMFRIVYGWPEGGTEAMKEFGRRLVKWKAAREETGSSE